MRIQILHFRSIRIRIQGFDDTNIFPLKNCNPLSLHDGNPSYWRSLQPSNRTPALRQQFIFFFTHQDPDPADRNQYGSGSTTLPYRSSQTKKIATIVYKNFSVKNENHCCVPVPVPIPRKNLDFASITVTAFSEINQFRQIGKPSQNMYR
jgi:hypothetical protein